MFQEITIQFTEECNVVCPYCFAPSKSEKMLSLEDFDKFVDFCSKEDIDVFHITGGEPTLNPHFSYFIEKLIKMGSVVVYSNFAVENVLEKINIENPKEVVFLVNITSGRFASDSQRNIQINNIKLALEKGFRVALSYTFFDPNAPLEKDFSYLMDMMREYKLRNLRLSQALSFGDSSKFYGKKDIENLYHYVAQNIQEWTNEGFVVYLDCPVPPCYVKPKDFKFLRDNKAALLKCIPKVFVMWNLNVTHCYSTMDKTEERHLTSFKNMREARIHSENLLKFIQSESNRSGCYKCSYSQDGIPCGCPSYCV